VKVLLFLGPRHREFVDLREPLRNIFSTALCEPISWELPHAEFNLSHVSTVDYRLEKFNLVIPNSARCGKDCYTYPVYITSFESLEEISPARIKLKALQRSNPAAFLDLVAFDILFRGDKPIAHDFISDFYTKLYAE
jgi:hypothetical protein